MVHLTGGNRLHGDASDAPEYAVLHVCHTEGFVHCPDQLRDWVDSVGVLELPLYGDRVPGDDRVERTGVLEKHVRLLGREEQCLGLHDLESELCSEVLLGDCCPETIAKHDLKSVDERGLPRPRRTVEEHCHLMPHVARETETGKLLKEPCNIGREPVCHELVPRRTCGKLIECVPSGVARVVTGAVVPEFTVVKVERAVGKHEAGLPLLSEDGRWFG